MKLSEVIKAIEDGSKSEFESRGIMPILKNGSIEFRTKDKMYVASKVSLDSWEEVKPPRQWSEKELMLFKLLPDWAKWIATDECGSKWLYDSKPIKCAYEFTTNLGKTKRLELFDFLTITFEESPIYIGDLKGE